MSIDADSSRTRSSAAIQAMPQERVSRASAVAAAILLLLGAAAGTGALALGNPLIGVAAIVTSVILAGILALRPRVRWHTESPWSLPLLLAPLALSLRAIDPNLSVITLAALLLLATWQPRNVQSPRIVWVVALLVIASVASWLPPQTLTSLTVAVLTVVLLVVAAMKVNRAVLVTSLADGIGLYLLANALLFFVFGLTSGEALERNAGMTIEGEVRAFFPLTSSLNLPPALAASYIAALPLLAQRGRKLVPRLIFLVAAVGVLLASNGRTALLIAVLLAFAVVAVPAALRYCSPAIAVLAMLVPFFYPAISTWVGSLLGGLASMVPGLDRYGTGADFGSLNGRSEIWGAALAYWPRLDTLTQWLGAGYPGHARTGASNEYGHLFLSWTANPTLASTHSSLLQQLYDGGLIGTILLAVVIVAVLLMWRRDPTVYGLIATGLLSGLVLTAATEIGVSPGASQESYWLFFALACGVSLSSPATTPAYTDFKTSSHRDIAAFSPSSRSR